ncbi:MAG: hypothetical protein DRO99_00900 [Candidatus Aenigmatarchaeota archaeon]|nr:MAG: hypothetical protein DRO99_00900 [Candidatus Aenigmarchaeota archaeon]
MIDLAFKNIKRRKTRTFLTTLGIVIGIAAIVALGSFAEGINSMVNEQLVMFAGKVLVMQSGLSMMSFQASDVTPEQIEMLRDMSGVEKVVPMIFVVPPFGPAAGGIPQWQMIGIDIEDADVFIDDSIKTYEGRRFERGESEVALIGNTVSDNLDLMVGDYWEYKDKSFEVVGVLEDTSISDVDTGIIVPLEDLKEALKTDSYQMAYVVLDDPDYAEDFAEEVEDTDDSLMAITSKDMTRQISGILDQINLFTFGIGLIAAFVGGLGVLNTMIMAVMERKKEIGVMKAIGGTRKFVLMQIVTESSMLSLLGGVIGLILGSIASVGLGMVTGGLISGLVTPQLAIGSLAFAFILGFLGGLYPAWKAARVDPVEALRG